MVVVVVVIAVVGQCNRKKATKASLHFLSPPLSHFMHVFVLFQLKIMLSQTIYVCCRKFVLLYNKQHNKTDSHHPLPSLSLCYAQVCTLFGSQSTYYTYLPTLLYFSLLIFSRRRRRRRRGIVEARKKALL